MLIREHSIGELKLYWRKYTENIEYLDSRIMKFFQWE